MRKEKHKEHSYHLQYSSQHRFFFFFLGLGEGEGPGMGSNPWHVLQGINSIICANPHPLSLGTDIELWAFNIFGKKLWAFVKIFHFFFFGSTCKDSVLTLRLTEQNRLGVTQLAQAQCSWRKVFCFRQNFQSL